MSETQQFVIFDGRYYLVATTKSYGTQGGMARAWTGEVEAALCFASREAAEECISREFGDSAGFYGVRVMVLS